MTGTGLRRRGPVHETSASLSCSTPAGAYRQRRRADPAVGTSLRSLGRSLQTRYHPGRFAAARLRYRSLLTC